MPFALSGGFLLDGFAVRGVNSGFWQNAEIHVNTSRLSTAALLTLVLWLPCAATAQVSRYVDVLPSPNPALTDLNDAVLYRGTTSGAQAFDGKLDDQAYVVGPGDFFEINIWSPTARNFVLSVTPEGTLLVPAVGEIPLAGKSLAEARELLTTRVLQSYPRSDVSATLTEARRVRVYVSGLVKQPGTYELFAYQRLADALARAGDILPEKGSLRRVGRTQGGVTSEFDLLSFYAGADLSQNPYLVGGEQIRVVPREPREDQLQISGAVASPGFVEFHPGDSVSDLIRFAFDFVPRADLQDIVVTRLAGSGVPEAIHVTASRDDRGWKIASDIELRRGDRVYVGDLHAHGKLATVAVYGEVERPGHYTVVEDRTTLTELVAAAGGLTPLASPLGAHVMRPSYPTTVGKDTIPPVVSIDIRRLLSGDLTADVPLHNGDSIFVPPLTLGVQMVGHVYRPGILPYQPERTVPDYIQLAGGYTHLADRGGVRIVRLGSGLLEKPNGGNPPLPGDQILIPGKVKRSTLTTLRDILAVVGVVATTYIIVDEVSE
jgi:protein involved in polysaccharide export with SLBB domain